MEEWEEPLHPGSLRANISHFLPQCNPICTSSPTFARTSAPSCAKPLLTRALPRRSAPRMPATPQAASRAAAARAETRVARRVRLRRGPARSYDRLRPPHERAAKGTAPCPPRAPRRRTQPRHRARARRPAPRAARAGRHALGLATGCGSSNAGGTSADPASAVPAERGAVRGRDRATRRALQKTSALAAGARSRHQADPYLRLVAALQTPGSPHAELQPRRRALARAPRGRLPHLAARRRARCPRCSSTACSAAPHRARSPSATGGAQGAIVLDTSDAAKARSFLDTPGRPARAHTRPATTASPTSSAPAAWPSGSSTTSR